MFIFFKTLSRVDISRSVFILENPSRLVIDFENIDNSFENDVLSKKWELIKDIRRVITGALELKRAEKIIGSSLEASIDIYISSMMYSKLQNIDFAEIAITSSATIIESSSFTLGFSIDGMISAKAAR